MVNDKMNIVINVTINHMVDSIRNIVIWLNHTVNHMVNKVCPTFKCHNHTPQVTVRVECCCWSFAT